MWLSAAKIVECPPIRSTEDVTLKILFTQQKFQGNNRGLMRSTLQNLKLTCLDIAHAGENTFMMDKKIRAVPLTRILKDIKPLS